MSGCGDMGGRKSHGNVTSYFIYRINIAYTLGKFLPLKLYWKCTNKVTNYQATRYVGIILPFHKC